MPAISLGLNEFLCSYGCIESLGLIQYHILDCRRNMAFRGGAKRSLGAILCSCRYSTTCNGRGFSTRVSNKRAVISQFTETQASNPLRLANAQCGSALFLVRRLSVGASSSSDQMSLIKQLRQRTSAPMKDVKAALIDCNWEIGIPCPFLMMLT